MTSPTHALEVNSHQYYVNIGPYGLTYCSRGDRYYLTLIGAKITMHRVFGSSVRGSSLVLLHNIIFNLSHVHGTSIVMNDAYVSFNPVHSSGIRWWDQAFACIRCLQVVTKSHTFLTISYKHTPLVSTRLHIPHIESSYSNIFLLIRVYATYQVTM